MILKTVLFLGAILTAIAGNIYITPLKGISWTPASPGSLSLWLDANDSTTINSGSPTTGDLVGTWKDKSGNTRDFSQATSGNKPTYTTNQLNGKPIISYDGNRILVGPSVNLIAEGTAWSFAIVAKCTAFNTSGFSTAIGLSTSGASASPAVVWTNNASFSDIYFGSNSHYAPFKATLANVITAYHTILLVYNGSGSTTLSNYTFYEDNSATTKTSVSAGGVTLGTTVLGNYGNVIDNFAFKGNMAEVMVWAKQLSAGDISSLASYISAKYGI